MIVLVLQRMYSHAEYITIWDMCGIAGNCGDHDKGLLVKQLRAIEHRGRDDRALYSNENVHLGMNRLAIVDLRRGIYPIRYKHFVLVYNGEIYNHEELRRQLLKKRIHVPGGCDAYVILPLYSLYGSRAFSMLEGMFAISIYDTKKRELILARDKSGEKPLYFTKRKDAFAFCSEINGLRPFLSSPSTNTASVRQYLSKGYVFGQETLLAGVSKLVASQYLVYNISTRSIKSDYFWQPEIATQHNSIIRTKAGHVQKLQQLIDASVKARMLSDVPIGCFISGGIDSAILAYFASTRTRTLRTYSVSFPGYHRNDESIFSRYIARRLKTDHTEVICTADSLRSVFEHFGELIDEPISDPAILPTLLLSREARKSVKVVLTGEGADEIFAGYPRYVRQTAAETVYSGRKIINPLLQVIKKVFPHRFTQLSLPLGQRYCAQRIWSEEERTKLNLSFGGKDSQIYDAKEHITDPLLRMQLSDYRGYLSEQLFMKSDKSTMAYNLESRAPYVDTDILNFAFNLPMNYKIHWFQGKYILRLVASLYFPAWFIWRPKHGFSVPLRDWFRTDLKEFAYLSIENIRTSAPSINSRYYQTIVDDHIACRADNADMIWNMFVLGSWLKHNQITL